MSRKKHVEQGYVQGDVEPPVEGQVIAMSLGTRGGNIVEVQFEDSSTTLCMIPAKFNKKLWIRKGGLVVVEQTVTGATDAKVTGTVFAVLYPEHLKRFRKLGVDVPQFGVPGSGHVEPSAKEGLDDGVRGDSDSSMPEIQLNTNQRSAVAYEFTDSEED
jgi:probable RNA-binding protein EIF1AD